MAEDASDQPLVRKSRGISVVWILPIIAIGLGGWLAYQQFQQRGPVITITFPTAAGIEAGKTKIRLRDVTVGSVTAVQVEPDLSGVIITAEMVKGAIDYLTDQTRFWIVQPEIGITGVSGLSTLLSGVYIGIEPITEGEPTRDFVGLPGQPPLPASTPGRRYLLETDHLGAIRSGSLVYYRDILVGEVTGYALGGEEPLIDGELTCDLPDDHDQTTFLMEVFVHAPFDQRVTSETAFRNVSGFTAGLQGGNIEFQLTSVAALVAGAIGFERLPTARGTGVPAEHCERFPLYDREQDLLVADNVEADRFLLFFEDDIRGLDPGAAVTFRGITVGNVTDVDLVIDLERENFALPVEIQFRRGTVDFVGLQNETMTDTEMAQWLISRGMRGQLATSDLFLGTKEIRLELDAEGIGQEPTFYNDRLVIPTIPSALDQLTASIRDTLGKVAALPLDEIGEEIVTILRNVDALTSDPALGDTVADAGAAMASIRQLADSLESQIGPALVDARGAAASARSALDSADRTMRSAEGLIANADDVPYTANQTLLEIRAMARSIRAFADYLERNPEALVRGRR